MGKVFEQIINRFDGGVANDLRSKNTSKFAITKHFDANTYPHKLVPYFNTTAIDEKTKYITKFLYNFVRNSTTSYVYGFGKSEGTDKARVYRMAVDGTIWESGANNTSGLDKLEGAFFYYKGYIYMFGGATKLIRYDTSGVDDFNDAYKTLTAFSTIAQPVYHPLDDAAYFFTDNKVHSLKNTSWEEAALTLPDNLKIVDGCPYGNYLAITCVSKASNDPQIIIYLWDRDSTLTTLTERIDFGNGNLLYTASLNNKLIAVIDYFIENSLGMKGGKLLIKQASGQYGVLLNELVSYPSITAQAQTTQKTKVIKNNKLYFPYHIPLNEDPRNGIWVVDSDGKVNLDFIEEDVQSATVKNYQGILAVGEKWWIAHSLDGSVNISDINSVWSATSIYESLIFNGGDGGASKKLIGVEVTTEPLLAAGQIILKYRVDEELDGAGTDNGWITIFTNTTNDSISHGAINIESTGANLPEFKEIQFRIESTGGAIITGLRFKFEAVDKQLF